MKYTKPTAEIVELSVKENIAAIPLGEVNLPNGVEYDEEKGMTTYRLKTYKGTGVSS